MDNPINSSIFSSIFSSFIFSSSVLSVWAQLGIPEPTTIAIFAIIMVMTVVFLTLLFARLKLYAESEKLKKFLFILIVIPVILATFYFLLSAIYLNLVSETKGPVHWHADFEVWACGKKYLLADPQELFENKVGLPELHEHNDNRIHVEGVLLKKEQASLGNFFRAVGGSFDGNLLVIPTTEGLKRWKNGDVCSASGNVSSNTSTPTFISGQPSFWHVFVNENPIPIFDPHNYVISPYPDVPPGDSIKFIFSEGAKGG